MTTEQKREAVAILYDAIEQHGLVQTLHTVFGKNLSVAIPMSLTTCEASIEEMELSVRAYNALRRTNVSTVGHLADITMAGELPRLRNLGAKSYREIQTKLLAYAYKEAPPAWRRDFLGKLLERKCRE